MKDGMARLDSELSQYKYCNEFERRTGVPKSYFVLGVAGLSLIMIFFNLAGQLLTNTISWVYPAYASFKAIESPSPDDDKQWLTYWTVIGFVQMVEYFSDILLFWFPFYYLFKTALVLWLALPQFRGAEIMYARFLRPFLLKAQTDIDQKTDEIRHKIGKVAVEFATGSSNKTD
ncbi:ER membrane protein DP1/Yop1 [Apophysomyces sp. BC1034]|nr:ER membrane protein DP1/Yop1 [Apophysomyces sp. BC1015]KAG0181321.1 ER membrane protein DP1/Yop1 [Apophysomyces sp. BC1021]KAG0189311.1 ER membrane protein DP1/Yop1 [Apophysomyces sp. BC1034]